MTRILALIMRAAVQQFSQMSAYSRKKNLWHPVPQEFDGSRMDCLPRGEKIVSFLAHVTSKILGDVLLSLR
jgi:hypothetical protein